MTSRSWGKKHLMISFPGQNKTKQKTHNEYLGNTGTVKKQLVVIRVSDFWKLGKKT